MPVIFCQKCGTKNQIGEEICVRCGTKLMILAYAHRMNSTLPILDEHFLERISALEYSIGRLDDRLNEIYDLVQQLSTDSFYDHTMIESIAEALKRLQIVASRTLNATGTSALPSDCWRARNARSSKRARSPF